MSSFGFNIHKVSAGYDQANIDYTIDVPAAKLTEWLVNRKLLGRGWKQNLSKIRDMVAKLQREIPNYLKDHDSMASVLIELQDSDKTLDYFTISHVLSVLKSVAATVGLDGKNFFGQYVDKRLQAWSELVGNYERGYLYIGESAQILEEWLLIDIPKLKRDIEKCGNQINQIQRKQKEYEKNIHSYRTQLNQQCALLNIAAPDYTATALSSADFRTALLSLTDELPCMFNQAVLLARSPLIDEAISFHHRFRNLTKHQTTMHEDDFRTLRYIIAHGNGTLQEMHTDLDKTNPKSTFGTSAMNIQIRDEEEEKLNINWVDSSELQTLDHNICIDWEDGTTGTWESESNPHQMNDNIQIVTVEAGIDADDVPKQDLKPNNTDYDLPSCNECETILSYAPTRNHFLNDVLELESFLLMRIDEEDSSTNKVVSFIPPNVQAQVEGKEYLSGDCLVNSYKRENIQQWLTALSCITNELFGLEGQLWKLIEMKSSGRFLDRLVGDLQQRQDMINKACANVASAGTQRQALEECLNNNRAQLDSLIANANGLKHNLELALSQVYKQQITIVLPL